MLRASALDTSPGRMFQRPNMGFPLLEHEFSMDMCDSPFDITLREAGKAERKGCSQRTPPRAAPAPFHERCVDPKSSQCPILGSTCPPGLAGLAPAHPRPCSNGQGSVLLFVFRSPTDEARWVTTQIFTCGNRLF